jgi:endonuclease/exonuclease/phosphatase family metal-dependent hydrolase
MDSRDEPADGEAPPRSLPPAPRSSRVPPGPRRGGAALALSGALLAVSAGACGGDGDGATPGDGGVDLGAEVDAGDGGRRRTGPGRNLPEEAFTYAWNCAGEVAPSGDAPASEPPSEDCSAGIWPDLDATMDVCPTVSSAMKTDPESGRSLPLPDARPLPTDIRVTESGSFLPDDLPARFPARLKVVTWNMEYTANLDAQIETLTTRPELRDADVYLLSEVDRCSARNGVRRAARMLARAVGGQYVYGIEYVELSIGRTVGGDTGQAIVSRRPLSGAALLCHSSQYDWLATTREPRLGQRVALHADVPVGDRTMRVYAVHFESNDALGEKRVVQVKELLDVAQSLACERPQIVAGDFNTWYPQAPELEVLRTSGFVDALAEIGDTAVTHVPTGFRLDYVWTRGFRAVRGGVLRDVTTSDHYPVWAELELN